MLLTNLIAKGTAPRNQILGASRLIALSKSGGGIRPIAIPDLFYRISYKTILKANFRSEMLLPNQLGVNSKGGVEPAIYILKEAIAGANATGSTQMASLDLANAFNSVSRSTIATALVTYAPTPYRTAAWAHAQASLLVTANGELLASSEGVRQGDPIGPVLFSLAFRGTVKKLMTGLPTATIVAYLTAPIRRLPIHSKKYSHSFF